MDFITGFIIWLVVGLVGGALAWTTFRGQTTTATMTFVFGVLGAFIGGMLGLAAYVFHDPNPLRFGGLLGAVLGALFFSYLYHFTARKAL